MAEQLDLSAPEAPPSNSSYRVVRLILDWEAPHVQIELRGANGETRVFVYTDAVARTMMRALNIADLSVKSLQRRILERLVLDGNLAGQITGIPG
jgi:hypothetical protein